MANQTFDDLTVDEKFKAVRKDIRMVAAHSDQNQSDIASIAQTISELRQEIQKLKSEVALLSKKDRRN